MPTIVIPFAADGKTRLHPAARIRRALAQAMFRDVLAAGVLVGDTRVVTTDAETAAIAREDGAETIADPGGGQGAGANPAFRELKAAGAPLSSVV